VPFRDQAFREMKAEKTGCSRNQDAHFSFLGRITRQPLEPEAAKKESGDPRD
jgi:hypothetical protein